MEGLIPFVIEAFRKSHERSTYRSVSSDGSSRGGGSRRHLMDYYELPEAAADDGASYRRARPDLVQATGARRAEEYGRPAAVATAGSAYRRK